MRDARAGPLLAIPYPQEVNDIPADRRRARTAPRHFAAMVLDDFEERLQQVRATASPQVMGIALHPYIIGQPYRLRALRAGAGGDRGAARRGLDHHRRCHLRPCDGLPEGSIP